MIRAIRKVTDPQEQQAETYRYWHTRPDSEIFNEIAKMSAEQYSEYYRLKGIVHAEGSNRSLARVQRSVS